MDLQEILKRTKQKSDKLNISRQPPIIAEEDRPYLDKAKEKVATKWRQSSDKVETNRGQTGDIPAVTSVIKRQSEDKVETKLETNYRQSSDKVETNLNFFSLVGNERKIIFYIYNCCKITLDKVTMPLSIENIAHACEINKKSIKKTMQRLTSKGIVIRNKYKNGRAGWTQYELHKTIYSEILQHESNLKLETNWRQSGGKVESKLETKASSSSISLINNTNTTTEESELVLQL